mmetsp:Transcript_10909/g.17184  ORF Transcript_10909/g.17184 Transcript_10909/m.17184 type:complete len:400 (-) Transcript_10909:5199-6398(-)
MRQRLGGQLIGGGGQVLGRHGRRGTARRGGGGTIRTTGLHVAETIRRASGCDTWRLSLWRSGRSVERLEGNAGQRHWRRDIRRQRGGRRGGQGVDVERGAGRPRHTLLNEGLGLQWRNVDDTFLLGLLGLLRTWLEQRHARLTLSGWRNLDNEILGHLLGAMCRQLTLHGAALARHDEASNNDDQTKEASDNERDDHGLGCQQVGPLGRFGGGLLAARLTLRVACRLLECPRPVRRGCIRDVQRRVRREMVHAEGHSRSAGSSAPVTSGELQNVLGGERLPFPGGRVLVARPWLRRSTVEIERNEDGSVENDALWTALDHLGAARGCGTIRVSQSKGVGWVQRKRSCRNLRRRGTQRVGRELENCVLVELDRATVRSDGGDSSNLGNNLLLALVPAVTR